jgi:hypothetical protein
MTAYQLSKGVLISIPRHLNKRPIGLVQRGKCALHFKSSNFRRASGKDVEPKAGMLPKKLKANSVTFQAILSRSSQKTERHCANSRRLGSEPAPFEA